MTKNEQQINVMTLGPLARIIDAYAVTTTDKSGNITYANEHFLKLSSYDADELVGRSHDITRSGVHDSQHWDEISSTVANGKVWHGELCNRSKSGNIYWTDSFIFPLSYIKDATEGYICLSTDITGIKSQNSQLINDNRKKDEIIVRVEDMLLNSERMASLGTISAGIAHEINNPTAFVSSNISTMKRYCETLSAFFGKIETESRFESISDEEKMEIHVIIDDCREVLEETTDGIRRIQRIVSDLKSFSHDKQEGFCPVNIQKCIDISLNLNRNEIKYKIKVNRNFESNTPEIIGSEPKLSQVFINLLINASHAIHDKGEINITTTTRGDKVITTISDTGAGIDPAILDTIFEPFFTTKGVGKGTGLGLSISQDIIKRHKGSIRVSSQPGTGTTFTIELPAYNPDQHHATRHAEA